MPANRTELEAYAESVNGVTEGQLVMDEFGDLILFGHHYSRAVWDFCDDYIRTGDPYWLDLAQRKADEVRQRRAMPIPTR